MAGSGEYISEQDKVASCVIGIQVEEAGKDLYIDSRQSIICAIKIKYANKWRVYIG